MFKKGLITDEVSQDFQTAARLAVKYKLDGLEIRSVWEKGPHELNRDDLHNIKAVLGHYGLEVCGISAPFFKCDIDNMAEVSQHMEILKKCGELANNLGTRLVRGFTFWSRGSFDENLNKIVDRFNLVKDIIEKENIILALEFDPSVYASNARKLVQVIQRINHPSIQALWDPGNDIYDPERETPYPDGYEIIKPYMVHMHLKDAKRLEDGKIVSTPVGQGQVDYSSHFSRLIKDGYNGYVVLETHYRPKHELSEELMALPKGSAFSYLGYEASEESLRNWLDILSSC